jgi:hypothetical protein
LSVRIHPESGGNTGLDAAGQSSRTGLSGERDHRSLSRNYLRVARLAGLSGDLSWDLSWDLTRVLLTASRGRRQCDGRKSGLISAAGQQRDGWKTAWPLLGLQRDRRKRAWPLLGLERDGRKRAIVL